MSLKAKEGGFVIYGDNNKGRILGVGNIGNSLTISKENVLYVEGLKHNLLSISQLCDKGFKIVFKTYWQTTLSLLVAVLAIPKGLM